MTISLMWLNDYLKLALTPDEISEALTSIGLEVEGMEPWESIRGGLRGVVAGKVLTCERHPDADRLSVTTVNVGHDKIHHIVCGANNIAAGQTVWVALPETELFDKTGKPWTIKVSKIRGQLSEGMICAEDELGLGTNHDGIIVLPDEVAVGTNASEYYEVFTDTLFEIGLTPNRSDATSIIGVAQDLAAFLSIQKDAYHPVLLPSIPQVPKVTSPSPFKVAVKNPVACPRYSGIVLRNIKIGPTPVWIQQRLQAIGIKTINNVVDITNFILHEMGQPLHAFDADQIHGKEIIVETKRSGTPFLALDNQVYQLHEEDLMICDGAGSPMCIGGVYGGLNSGVKDTTTSIFLEAAHFNAGWVRRTSMRHNLRTEAARRFEKGSDPNITTQALARAADLMMQYAGAVVASDVYDIYPNPISPAQVQLNLVTLNEKTGVRFNPLQVEKLLDALRMEYEKKGNDAWIVAVPTNKADVLREVDVIEELLRIYGFINVELPQKMHTSVAIEARDNPHKFRRLLGQFLASNGFLECMNMSLTQPGYYKGIEWTDSRQWVTIHNTSNESLNLLRPEMIIPTLETIRRNVNRKQEDLRLFEFGKSYLQKKELPEEEEHLVIAMTGNQSPASWLNGSPKQVDYFSLKAAVLSLFQRLGIHPDRVEPLSPDQGFEFGVEYYQGEVRIGRMGCVSMSVADRFDIRQPVYLADLHFHALIHLSLHHTVEYEELNRFPAVVRDLAIVIQQNITFEQVQQVVDESGGDWLTQLEVFDIYKNTEHLGEGKMSMALRFTIENKEATLADKDIDQWFGNVQRALVKGVGAEVRK